MEKFTKEQLIERAKSVIHLAARHPESHTARLDAAINETALAALTAKPFMYGIEDCDVMAYFAEHCVSSNPAHLSDELQTADDESGEGAKVIPLYRLPEID